MITNRIAHQADNAEQINAFMTGAFSLSVVALTGLLTFFQFLTLV